MDVYSEQSAEQKQIKAQERVIKFSTKLANYLQVYM